MRSIFTKYIPPSNVRGSRYKAWDSDNHFKVTLSASDALSSEENHIRVAQALKDKAGWKGKMICGDTNVGLVCVFVDSAYKLNPISEKTAHKIRKAAPGTFAEMTDEEIKRAVKVPRKKVKKNPAKKKVYRMPKIETFYVIGGRVPNKGNGFLTERNTLTDRFAEALQFTTKKEADKVLSKVEKQFPYVKWEVLKETVKYVYPK